MEIVPVMVGKFVDYTIVPIGRQLKYVCFMRQYIQTLKREVEMLKDTKESVEHKISEARRNADNIESSVRTWLTKVDAIIDKSERITLNNEAQQLGLCFNFVRRHQLSRKASKLVKEVLQLKNGGKFDSVSYTTPLSEVESSRAKRSDFLDFESREPTVKQIICALKDDNVKRIGVYGMGGVGKTMLVKNISRIVKKKKLFDEVVTSTIHETPDLEKIQQQLADKLELRFKEETEEGRVLKLEKRLKKEKSILIVLDDIWNYIDLERIGIPRIEDHTGCKIIFTSRNKNFLDNMLIHDNFEIKVLQEDETWDLFKTMAGEIVETSNLKSIAVEIAKECGHLPIAITMIAKALRKKPLPIWQDALRQLRNPANNNIGIDEKVHSSLKLSYEQLDCKEAKLLFLFCSMFPKESSINVPKDLLVYAMGMGFLSGVDTMAQAQHKLTKLVDDLISSSLLLEEPENEWGTCVKMQNILRDVALSISSKDDCVRILSYSKGSDESGPEKKISWPEKKISGDHTVVYLDIKDLCNPPQKLMLPKVQSLTLCGPFSDECDELPITFFEEMKELKILYLVDIKISLWTLVLYSFANLHSLCFIDCELENIDMIGELNKLKILSFKGSNIIRIPMAMRQLTQLKVLDLSRCYSLKVIPPNILISLTKLEKLYLGTFSGWEGEELNEGRRNASLSELGYLSHLYVLELRIPDESIMPKQLFSRRLDFEEFHISVGCEPRGYWTNKISKVLCLKMERESCMNNGIKMLLKKSEELHLIGSIGARVLQFELNHVNHSDLKYLSVDSPHLKHLYIQDDSEIQHLYHEQNEPLQKALSKLLCLELRNLKNLESLFYGHVRESPINSSILNDILHLEEIYIIDCKVMKAIIIMGSETTTQKIEFTNLRSLKLHGLPRLQTFFCEIEKFGDSSLDDLKKDEMRRFDNDDSFFHQQVSLPKLKELEFKEVHNLKIICHNILLPNLFCKLKILRIVKCDRLEKVFPSNIMSRLTCLKILHIESCKLLERVFEVQEANLTKEDIDFLPNLRHLELNELPSLQYIWEKNSCELLNLKNMKTLSIYQCPKLKLQYPVKVIQQVKELGVDFSGLKEILRRENSMQMPELDEFETSKDGPKLFSKLKSLKLYGCNDHRQTDLPMEFVQVLQNLEEFKVSKALFDKLFPIERLTGEEQQNDGFKIQYLSLLDLPKLKHLWSGDSQKNSSILQNLGSLMSPSMSFRNLKELSVKKCPKLTSLLNPSIARTMVQLEALIIKECKRVTTIIDEGVENDDDEILFNKLCKLTIEDLPNLTSFHSVKCTIKFSNLRQINIKNCPEMRNFSLGIVSTPCLPTENIGYYGNDLEWSSILKDSKEIIVEHINDSIHQVWKDNYDTDIKSLFKEQNLEEKQCDCSSNAEKLESD